MPRHRAGYGTGGPAVALAGGAGTAVLAQCRGTERATAQADRLWRLQAVLARRCWAHNVARGGGG
ncbi:hypothetical protein CBW46_010025 [Paenibacillus xerothermodurans]|uniref:Uncharacterized protein n=1 Tax=Paenibacillus xerothermodurans TaxID=1977292 RepID=A0A2W1NZV8_PAEXE|nr:hypothetical protein CBW46_010025 [Paenibacillus xerothermodurans]